MKNIIFVFFLFVSALSFGQSQETQNNLILIESLNQKESTLEFKLPALNMETLSAPAVIEVPNKQYKISAEQRQMILMQELPLMVREPSEN